MRIDILTLFPAYFEAPLQTSIVGRAKTNKLVDFTITDIRVSSFDKHGTVDDTPYGGGPGMVLKVDVLKESLDSVITAGPAGTKPCVVLLTPQGEPLTQQFSRDLANKPWLVFICGHYEGFDERVRDYVDLELSVGPYVLSGGEPAALVAIDSIVRLLPGVTGHEASTIEETFSLSDEAGRPLIEYPHYTRPEVYDGKRVPDILLSGNHAAIATWRLEEAKKRTQKRQGNQT